VIESGSVRGLAPGRFLAVAGACSLVGESIEALFPARVSPWVEWPMPDEAACPEVGVDLGNGRYSIGPPLWETVGGLSVFVAPRYDRDASGDGSSWNGIALLRDATGSIVAVEKLSSFNDHATLKGVTAAGDAIELTDEWSRVLVRADGDRIVVDRSDSISHSIPCPTPTEGPG
jgi:hypothetical protein